MESRTKPRVLFVDDEADLLAGLRQSLRRERKRWDMTFACGAADALRRVRDEEPDAVVCDLKMPGMNGVELLEEVARLAPRCLRFMLSGDASEELSIRSIPVTHQWMSKPCSRETMVEVVERSLAVVEHIQSPEVRELVVGVHGLPAAPSSYRRLLDATQGHEPDLDVVAELIEGDPALAARVLQLTNSSYFGRRREVVDVREAVSALGLRLLTDLVLATEVFGSWADGASHAERDADTLLEHSHDVVRIARAIAADLRADLHADLAAGPGAGSGAGSGAGAIVDEGAATTAALLHDVGALLLACHVPAVSSRIEAARGDEAWWVVEERELGCTHAEIGAALLQSWGVPLSVVEAVAYHHTPGRSGAKQFDLVGVVHVANALAQNEPLDEDYLAAVGRTDDVERWRALASQAGGIE